MFCAPDDFAGPQAYYGEYLPLAEDQREVAGILVDNARRLSTLIEDLLKEA